MSNIKKQSLILPMNDVGIEAGYKHPAYTKYWTYEHLGADLTGKVRTKSEKILSSGEGKVISAGRDYKYGFVISIVYYNAYNHKTKKTQDVIARYMHMSKLYVKSGDVVKRGTAIGDMGGYGSKPDSYALHLHIEFDYDIEHPDYSGQVSGSNIFKRGSKSTMLSPFELFHIYKPTQKIKKYSNSWCFDEELNLPYSFTTQYEEVKNKMQKLILPVNNMTISCSYKNKAYESLVVNGKRMGTHYGLDYYGSVTTTYGSGNGTVLATGYDNCFGNFIVIGYDDVYNHVTKKTQNILFRYFHFASVKVKVGDTVNKDTVLGNLGNSGLYSSGLHTHLEADYDCVNWEYTPTLVGNTTYFRAGNRGTKDTTFNPCEVFHIKASKPDNQTLKRTQDNYTSENDISLPKII